MKKLLLLIFNILSVSLMAQTMPDDPKLTQDQLLNELSDLSKQYHDLLPDLNNPKKTERLDSIKSYQYEIIYGYDGDNRVTSVNRTDGECYDTLYTYYNGQLSSVEFSQRTPPLTESINGYSFDNQGRIISSWGINRISVGSAIDETSSYNSYTYDATGHIISFSSTERRNTPVSMEDTDSSCEATYNNGRLASIVQRIQYVDPMRDSEEHKTAYFYTSFGKLCQELKSYNGVEKEKNEYDYYADYSLKSIIHYVWFADDWAETSKTEYEYTSSSSTEIRYTMNWGEWEKGNQYVKVYDADGHVIESYTRSNTGVVSERNTWSYDSAGHETSHKIYDNNGNVQVSYSWSYDASGNLLVSNSPGFKFVYTYNEMNQRTSESFYYGSSLSSRITWDYDDSGLLIAAKGYEGNSSTPNFERYWCKYGLTLFQDGWSKVVNEYDANGNLTKNEQYSGSNGTYSLTERTIYSYDTTVLGSSILNCNSYNKILKSTTYTSLGSYTTKYFYSDLYSNAGDDDEKTIDIVDGESSFDNYASKTYETITYTRNFSNTKWQALYVPFRMSYEDWQDDFDVAFINSVRQYDHDGDGTIDETIMDVLPVNAGTIYANTPYLIRAKTTGTKTLTLSDATLYPTDKNSIECSTMLATYTFTGTYTTISAAECQANQYYAMGGGSLIMTNGSSSLKPFRWYMSISSRSPMYDTTTSNPARISIHVIGEDDETGLSSLIQEEELDDKIFTLNGQKIQATESLRPGLYIKNGRKIIVK